MLDIDEKPVRALVVVMGGVGGFRQVVIVTRSNIRLLPVGVLGRDLDKGGRFTRRRGIEATAPFRTQANRQAQFRIRSVVKSTHQILGVLIFSVGSDLVVDVLVPVFAGELELRKKRIVAFNA